MTVRELIGELYGHDLDKPVEIYFMYHDLCLVGDPDEINVSSNSVHVHISSQVIDASIDRSN